MDRKTILAILISFGIFLSWQHFVLSKYQQVPSTEGVAAIQAASGTLRSEPREKSAVPQTSVASVAREQKKLILAQGELGIGNGARALEFWNYSTSSEVISSSEVVGSVPQLDLTVDHPDYSFLGSLVGNLRERSAQELEWTFENDAVQLKREVVARPTESFVDVSWNIKFKKAAPKVAFVSLISPLQTDKGEAADRKLVYLGGKTVETLAASENAKLTDVLVPTAWIGIENRYFILSALDRSGTSRALVQPLAENGNRLSLVYPVNGNSAVIPIRVYFGPKKAELLKKASPSLVTAIDFGWLTPLALLILNFMNWLFSFLKNYGVAIIVLTTVLKILLYPLTYKSMKSMKKMATLQPQLQKLREKYANDKEALNREMLTLMRTHGYNPMAGCLPMLIQMPVFFALYRVLYGSFELYQAPFALWIHDLSAKDPWYVTPVLLTAVMYFQQKLTPSTATDPAQAKMIQWMPVIFGVFMIQLPSGLTLYMLTNAVVSIIQQLILNKKLEMVAPAPAIHGKKKSP
ncbi:MAG: YidC/Oxa1 family insertase periplasmic-domain containing protein [Oligoflexia bacterium]